MSANGRATRLNWKFIGVRSVRPSLGTR